MISYTNHTQKALFKRMVAPLETKHASFFSPRISRVILSSSFLTSTSFTPSFFFQQLEKDIFFFLIASTPSYLSPCHSPRKCLSCHVAPFFVQFCLLPSDGCVSPFLNNSLSIAFLPVFHPIWLAKNNSPISCLSFTFNRRPLGCSTTAHSRVDEEGEKKKKK